MYNRFNSFRVKAPFSYHGLLKKAAYREGGWNDEGEHCWELSESAFCAVANKLGDDVVVIPPRARIVCSKPIGSHNIVLRTQTEEVRGGNALHVLALSADRIVARFTKVDFFNFDLVKMGANRDTISGIAANQGVSAFPSSGFDFEGKTDEVLAAVEANLPAIARDAGWTYVKNNKSSAFRFVFGLAKAASTAETVYPAVFTTSFRGSPQAA